MSNEKSYIQTVMEDFRERNKAVFDTVKAKAAERVVRKSGINIDALLAIPDDGVPNLAVEAREQFMNDLDRVADWCSKLLRDAMGLDESTLIEIRKLRRFIWVDLLILNFGNHDQELKWPEVRALISKHSNLLSQATVNP